MTIVCPDCGRFTDGQLAIRESSFEWDCRGCGRSFEVRIVFLSSRKNVDTVAFIAQVKGILKEQGLSRTDLARLLGVTPAYMSTILSGRRKISGTVAERILSALRPSQPRADGGSS